jgi:hypothetical protein
MPTAIKDHITPTRRSALGFSVAAIVAGFTVPAIASLVPATSGPDAELHRLCAEFHREHALVYLESGDLAEKAQRRRWLVSDQIQGIIAQTPAGRVAKAKVAIEIIRECKGLNDDDWPDDADMQFAYSALLDVAGEAA